MKQSQAQHHRRRRSTSHTNNPSSNGLVVLSCMAAAVVMIMMTQIMVSDAFVLPSQSSSLVGQKKKVYGSMLLRPLHSTRDRTTETNKLNLKSNGLNVNGDNNNSDNNNRNVNGNNDKVNGDNNNNSDTLRNNGKTQNNNEKKSPPPGSPLNMICNEGEIEESYELKVGRALDTLRKDYPHILTDQPGKAILNYFLRS